MGASFSAPANNFFEEAKLFYGNRDHVTTVTSWENGSCDTMIFGDKHIDGTLPQVCGENKYGKPVFQSDLQESMPDTDTMKIKSPEHGGTLVYETTGALACKAFMPAGFRSGPTPNTMNPYRSDIGNPTGKTPQNCATSWGHIVVIPVNQRIYNAVTLTKDHIELLNEMERVGKHALKILTEESVDYIGSLRWAMAQDGTMEMNDGRVVSTKLQAADFVDDSAFLTCQTEGVDSVTDMINSTTESTFHVGRAASVGWLHLHVRPTCFDLISKIGMDEQASEKGYLKQTLLSDVIDAISSEELETIRAQSEVLEHSEPEPELDVSEDDDDEGPPLSRQYSVRR